ncbi:MAG: hypothetical protein IJO64_03475 [Clostridia bacterium]|nr:hypothetical protein [Clostridia bacterium]
MGYIYDLHVHSKELSGCSSSAVRDMVRAYKESVYSGFVLTNHFSGRTNPLLGEVSWEEKVTAYWNAYLDGKQLADELGVDMFFGLEYGYGMAQEILLYGIDVDFLLAHPDLCDNTPEQLTALVQNSGGFVSHAHPFRNRFYVPKDYKHMDLTCLDAIEIFNAGNMELDDAKAVIRCNELGLKITAGSDMHHCELLATTLNGGIEFPERVTTNAELVAALKSGEGKLYRHGTR